MSEENHRLVILGSMDEFVDLVECAKKRGIYTIVCDGYEDGPAKAHADKAYLESLYRQGAEKAAAIASRTLRKVHKKVGFVPR